MGLDHFFVFMASLVLETIHHGQAFIFWTCGQECKSHFDRKNSSLTEDVSFN
jgi:hypothetical protein